MNKSSELHNLSEQAASYGIDWFQGTMKGIHHIENWMIICLPPQITRHQSKHHSRSINGYNECYEWDCGVKVMRHDKHPDMGVHVIFSGTAWRTTLEDTGLSDQELINYYNNDMFKPTRIDVRCDGFNFDVSARTFATAVEDGECQTSMHSKTYIHGIDTNADTLYVGSLKKRSKLLRIYDKGIVEGLDVNWIRFEAEFRQSYAKSATAHIFAESKDINETIKELIIGIADFPEIEAWRVLLGDNGLKIVQPATGVGNTKKWLLTSVAKSLANEVFKDPDFEQTFIAVFKGILNRMIDKHFNADNTLE